LAALREELASGSLPRYKNKDLNQKEEWSDKTYLWGFLLELLGFH
jgi:hypothetical protein